MRQSASVKLFLIAFGVCTLAFAFFLLSSGPAQTVKDADSAAPNSQLELGWNSMSSSELLLNIDKLSAKQSYLLAVDRELIGRRAAELIAQGDVDTDRLWTLATEFLTPEQKQGALQALKGKPDNNISALRTHARLIALTSESAKEVATRVQEWLKKNDASSLSGTDMAWLAKNATAPAVDPNDFSATWTGNLLIPETGPYSFSIGAFDNSYFASSSDFSEQHSTVTVAGKTVATQGGAEGDFVQSKPIELAKGDVIPIRVTLKYARGLDPSSHAFPVVTLFWDGPGIPQQIIASEYFQKSDGSPGLSAEYLSAGSSEAVHRSESRLDHFWMDGQTIGLDNQDLGEAQELADQAWKKLLARPSEISRASDVAELLPLESRSALLESLRANSDTLAALSWDQIVHVYQTHRFVNPDAAIDLLGAWMSAHSLPSISVSERFDDKRFPYHRLALLFVDHAPKHAEVLSAKYLRDATGKCCLPVAYTLSYVADLMGTMDAWTSQLDATIDSGLTADAKATWLLARAMAEELQYLRSPKYFPRSPRPLAGDQWLQDAAKEQVSPDIKQYLLVDMVSRYVAERGYDTAKGLLNNNSQNPQNARLLDQIEQIKTRNLVDVESQILAHQERARRSNINSIAK